MKKYKFQYPSPKNSHACVPLSILSTRIQCVRWGGGVWGPPMGSLEGRGPQTVKTCRKVPLQINFLDKRHLALHSINLIFLRIGQTIEPRPVFKLLIKISSG
jgi:hypothetical protein